MPESTESPHRVYEGSIAELNAQVIHVLSSAQHILNGQKPLEEKLRPITVMIDGRRAQASIVRVACTIKYSIICWATATPDGSPNVRHKINLIFRHNQWIVSIKHSSAMASSADMD